MKRPSPDPTLPPVRVAFLGTGWALRTQVPAFRMAGLEAVALWNRSEEKARRLAAEHGIPLGTADLGGILERPDVDLVSVTTPPHTHRELALAALEAGKHVLCEKPFALDAGEAETMVAAARARPDRLALVDHELRFLPVFGRLRELLADGWAGELFHVEATHHSAARLDPEIPFTWWSDRARGGGYWGAIGSHYTDLLRFLLGRRVTAVSAALRTLVPERRDREGRPRPVSADDQALVTLRLAAGDGEAAPALLHLSTGVAGAPPPRLLVAGSRGALRYEDRRLLGQRLTARGAVRELEDLTPEPVPEQDVGAVAGRDDDWSRGSVYLGRALREALGEGDGRGLTARAATFEDGLRTQRVLDAGRASSDAAGAWTEIEDV